MIMCPCVKISKTTTLVSSFISGAWMWGRQWTKYWIKFDTSRQHHISAARLECISILEICWHMENFMARWLPIDGRVPSYYPCISLNEFLLQYPFSPTNGGSKILFNYLLSRPFLSSYTPYCMHWLSQPQLRWNL